MSRRSSLEKLNRDIDSYKKQVSRNEGVILNNITRSNGNSPEKMLRTQTDNISSPAISKIGKQYENSPNSNDQELVNYIQNIKKLNNSLQEKSYVMEVDQEKQKLQFQSTISKLEQEINLLSGDLTQKQQRVDTLRSQVKQLESIVAEKNKQVQELEQEVAHYRKESVTVKEENKKYKADNKIIMGQIDKLSQQTLTPEEKIRIMEEKQMRVIKSLYQDTLPLLEQREQKERIADMNETVEKKRLVVTAQQNGELKSLIRRLNDEIDVLKIQKALLTEENKQKTLNLQTQRQIAELAEETNVKLSETIGKMGDKIMSLEQINQTIRQGQGKNEFQENYVESYYHTTRSKVGQFYYKR